MPKVYVLNKHGHPLMPCTPAKARHLLDSGKAKVRKRTPFTIQLLYGSSGYKQPVTLGVDAGSKTIGLSASTEKQELFAAEVKPRNDVVELLSTRREFRQARRNRKTRYRTPRFDNRVKSKHKGWLAPSVEVKIQEHITAIARVCALLPIANVIVETAEFDTHRLKAMLEGHPLPVGTDYQLGEMYDEYNVRQYVLKRDNYTCQCCGAHPSAKKGVKLHVHHLESRKTGGNSPNNLITLCEHCHKLLHKGKITLDKKKRGHSMRDAAFMGIMRKTLILRLRSELTIPVVETYGYITKLVRETHHMDKSHTVDALCIAGQTLQRQFSVKKAGWHESKRWNQLQKTDSIGKRNKLFNRRKEALLLPMPKGRGFRSVNFDDFLFTSIGDEKKEPTNCNIISLVNYANTLLEFRIRRLFLAY